MLIFKNHMEVKLIRFAHGLRLAGSVMIISTFFECPALAEGAVGTADASRGTSTPPEVQTTEETQHSTSSPALKTLETSTSTSTATTVAPDGATKVESGRVTTTSSVSSTGNETVEGPLFEQRKLVLTKIMAAKKQGTGIGGYLAEYGRIEQMVKSGEPEANYAERLSSLQSGVDEQLKRSQILKSQHPIPSASGFNTSFGSNSGSNGGGGKIAGMSINDLKAKYGDKVPPGVAEKLGSMTPEQREKLLQSDLLKKFLSK